MSGNNPFDNAMAQLKKAAAYLPQTKELKQKLEILKEPQRIINVTIPVKMDDGIIR